MTDQEQKKKYFIFMDESGNNTQDRFFVLGILMVPVEEIGELFDVLERLASMIKARSREKMNKRVDDDYVQSRMNKVLESAKSVRSFEMKFSAINEENADLYIEILHEFFKRKNYRFSAIVFERQRNDFKPDGMTHWDRYINNAAMLIASNIKNIERGEFVVIADQITQPKGQHAYENYLCEKICERLEGKGLTKESLFGSIRIESHSATFLQLVDLLVGAVGYDFLGEDKKRKNKFMAVLRKYLSVSGKIQSNFTRNDPNYFSVWKYEKK